MSELPAGWLAVKLGDVVAYASSTTVQPEKMQPDAWLLELEDIERDSSRLLSHSTVQDRKPKSAKNSFHAGDVLYGKLRPYLNKVVRAGRSGYCSSEIIPIKPNQLDGGYLFHYMKSPYFLEYVRSVTHGIRMPRLGTHQAKAAPFPLPPLAEQKRIAQKLDALLAQVDTLKARIDAIPAVLNLFRQATLTSAVSGQLTEEWRSQQATRKNDRSMRSLSDLSELITSGSRGWADYYSETGAIFIRSQDINADELDLTNTAFVNLPEASEGKRTRVKAQDLLITITGANVGKVARVLEAVPEAYVSQHVGLVRLHEPSLAAYVEMYLKDVGSGRGSLRELAYGGGKPGLNLTNLKELVIPVPDSEERKEVVRRVEQLFAFAEQLDAKVSAAQKRIDTLTQSLLAKAFRGELVPQDPNDEPASVLLERIRTQRAAAPKPKRGRKAAAR